MNCRQLSDLKASKQVKNKENSRCPCHKVNRVEAVGLPVSNYTFEFTILWVCEIRGNFVKILYFVNNCLIKVRIKKTFTHMWNM